MAWDSDSVCLSKCGRFFSEDHENFMLTRNFKFIEDNNCIILDLQGATRNQVTIKIGIKVNSNVISSLQINSKRI